ncbi:MAG: hypothetical protein EXX96DRAFT_113151 [Benjaminiella poitrasii]|nr:MAG: hypothetical protein EXX96DRAFT_113151 [Benjaminiella poitrasii]
MNLIKIARSEKAAVRKYVDVPRSSAELSRQASVIVEPTIPIRLYFRSADLLIKQARVYKLEHDLEHAYVLYMKYTMLGLNELPKHPSYKDPENKKSLKLLNKCYCF